MSEVDRERSLSRINLVTSGTHQVIEQIRKEELAKVGSADRTQIYGEIGLKYGNEAAHGVYRGFFA